MKKTFIFLIANLIAMNFAFSQGVAINSTGTAASSSAMLDVNSTNQGVLIPRMTATQRNSIPSPAIGLLIFNTETNRLNYYKTTGWYELSSSTSSSNNGNTSPGGGTAVNLDGSSADPSAILDISSTTRGFLLPRTTTSSITAPVTGLIIYDNANNNYKYYNGSAWKTLCETFITSTTASGNLTSQGSAINTTKDPAALSAMMDISSTTKGLLIPRMATTAIGQIKQVKGLIVYDNTTNTINFADGTNWYLILSDLPAAPTAGTNVVTKTSITWKWNTVSGATGYKWSIQNDWATGTDNGTSLEYTQSGLICNTTYKLYVWAYNNCGHSSATTLTQKTDDCTSLGCTWNNSDRFTVTHTAGTNGAPVTKTVTYKQVQTAISGASHCWITQNLGADRGATSLTDTTNASRGWYWQFNRTQGYMSRGINFPPIPQGAFTDHKQDNTGPNGCISGGNYNNPAGVWVSVNDPCTLLLGAPWRMPTQNEYDIASGMWATYNDAYASVLKLHNSGWIDYDQKNYNYQIGNYDKWGLLFCGGIGAWWSSTQSTDCPKYDGMPLYIYSYFCITSKCDNAVANALRCLR